MKKRLLITTIPFGEIDSFPLQMLKEADINFKINPNSRKYKPEELKKELLDINYLIAGTDNLSSEILDNAKNLELIVRLGIGLDSVDLSYAKKRNIKVSYTPDGPTSSVAEFTLGLIISSLRQSFKSHIQMKDGNWKKYLGKSISECNIGILGAGRIGREVIRLISQFNPNKILVCDPLVDKSALKKFKINYVVKRELIKLSDLISIHIPLTNETKNFFSTQELIQMKPNCHLINTSRGGIINENDLYNALKSGEIEGAAIDVFENEPYNGNLKNLENCIITSHMSPMSSQARLKMENDVVREVINFKENGHLNNEVPNIEYEKRENRGI